MSVRYPKRRVLIGYDHSEVSNSAMEWIVQNRAIFPEDDITLAIIVNDDAISVEGTFGLESSAIGPAGWMTDDYRERVNQVERDSRNALQMVVNWFGTRGVSLLHNRFMIWEITFVYIVYCTSQSIKW